MARLTSAAEIRSLLRTDPLWSVYALGDLLPDAFAKSKWFAPGLTLVYSDYGTCILFALGEESIAEALTHVSWPVHLQVLPRTLELLDRLAVVTRRVAMWRMGWNGERSGWVDTTRARRLTAADVPALEDLYSDGALSGEAPDFFFPSMVTAGVFWGVYEDRRLVAAAGTHLYAPAEGAVAIGNVYVHRQWRRRGLGKLVTCAVLRAVAESETVGLNVRMDNAAAVRVYESLGFRKHCGFFEALATAGR
ncbi:MAG: GNAT family N-acetyltransferase [Bryobacterales bacterium]|nr:GNAT family N-acetyltransferase [Bryobacterales bacterium]